MGQQRDKIRSRTWDILRGDFRALLLEEVSGKGGQRIVDFLHQLSGREVRVAQQPASQHSHDSCAGAAGEAVVAATQVWETVALQAAQPAPVSHLDSSQWIKVQDRGIQSQTLIGI